jgi:carbonic anhydrase/acetyltransferase-like protein (isoleucine patch superfamily)
MLRPFLKNQPTVHPSAWIADSAEVIGRVHLAEDVSVWSQCVLRGDVVSIHVGARTNLQEFVLIHGNHGDPDVRIGADVTVGHRATLHGCRIEDRVLVGMGAIVLDGVTVQSDVMIAAGSVVSPRSVLASGGLYIGSPARRRRELTSDELEGIRASAYHYVQLTQMHLGRELK